METLDGKLGKQIPDSAYTSEVHFFTLACFIYDHMYGLGSPMKRKKAKAIPASLVAKLTAISRDIESRRVPKRFEDPFGRASTDLGRRKTRLRFFQLRAK